MREELCDDTKAVRFEAVDSLVVVRECFLEKVGPHPVQLAEALSNHAVELLVCALLAGALDDHRGELVFQAMWQVDAHEFVHALLKSTTALDG